MKEVKLDAQWIWCKGDAIKDDKVIFRKAFELERDVKEAVAYIAVDTKYWLYVNGKQAVFEGGLFRESRPGCGYADQIDISPYLKIGRNVIAVLCWYYGNEGRNNTDSKEAGMILECGELGIYSGSSFLCRRHPAFYETKEPLPAYLYGGYNLGFDANKDIGDFYLPDFDDSSFETAQTRPNRHWGKTYERPIPLLRIGMPELESGSVLTRRRNQYVLKLPYAMNYCPYIELDAKGGEVVTIVSDRYAVRGGPGDEGNIYNGHRIEYICHPGLNRFESILYLFGEEMILQSDNAIDIRRAGYRETGYDCDVVGSFDCDCEVTNQLVKKAARTLYICMRDNFMDCPDRERGQWIGDVSVQVPQAVFLLSRPALKLIRKAISDFIQLRKGDIFVGNVPGAHCSELPAQSLNAISEIGLIAEYYKYTGDAGVLEEAFEPAINYLKLWKLGEDGILNGRDGDWRWFDHLYNVDEEVLENAWYYSALRFALKMADVLGDCRFRDWLEERKQAIESSFNRRFWKGSYYSSGSFADDRANAMAVLSGLCPAEYYPCIRKILVSVFHASIYMENYVLRALCEMGYVKEAYKRMVSRYYNLAMNENSTLWEDFYILGSKNHAWSGSPAMIAFRYFMGIKTTDGFKTVRITPDRNLFKKMHGKFYAGHGFITVDVNNETGEVHIDNHSASILLENDGIKPSSTVEGAGEGEREERSH